MEHINLVRKIAWSFHRTTGLAWDDLFQEASVAYVEALETYDPTRGRPTTHLWTCMRNSLLNYTQREHRTNGHIATEAEIYGHINHEGVSPTPDMTWEDILARAGGLVVEDKDLDLDDIITRAGGEVVSEVLEHPERYDLLSPQEARLAVAQELRAAGASWRDIWAGIHELKLALT